FRRAEADVADKHLGADDFPLSARAWVPSTSRPTRFEARLSVYAIAAAVLQLAGCSPAGRRSVGRSILREVGVRQEQAGLRKAIRVGEDLALKLPEAQLGCVLKADSSREEGCVLDHERERDRLVATCEPHEKRVFPPGVARLEAYVCQLSCGRV